MTNTGAARAVTQAGISGARPIIMTAAMLSNVQPSTLTISGRPILVMTNTGAARAVIQDDIIRGKRQV